MYGCYAVCKNMYMYKYIGYVHVYVYNYILGLNKFLLPIKFINFDFGPHKFFF